MIKMYNIININEKNQQQHCYILLYIEKKEKKKNRIR